jgi:MFS family permease
VRRLRRIIPPDWRRPFALPGTTKRTQRALRLFWLDGLLISTSTSLVSKYLVLYALAFGATSAQIGLMSTLVSVGSILALLPGAQLAERWLDPKKAVLIFSRGMSQLVWLSLGLLPFVLTGQPEVYGVMALRSGRSLTVQAASSAWTALAGRAVPRRLRGKYFAARNIAKQAASLLVVPAAGWVINRLGFPLGYQLCFGLAAIVGILAFAAYARIPFEQPDPPVKATEGATEAWAPAARRNFWLFSGASFVWNFSLRFAGPFFSVYLVEEFGATAGVIGTLAAVHSLTAMPGQALFGRWLDRHGIKWTFRLSGLLIPFIAWAWLLVGGPWGALPIHAAAGFLFAGYNLSRFNMMLVTTPKARRTHQIAVYKTVVQSANALAPLLGGLAIGWIGFLPVFAISGAGRMLSTILLLSLVREPQQTERAAR